MNIINLKNKYGSYSIQSWPNDLNIPDNHAIVPDYLNKSIFFEHNGFVTLTTKTEDKVVGTHEESKEVITVNDDGEEVAETIYETVENTTTITVVTAWEPNIEAWENWKASIPEKKPRHTPLSNRVSNIEAQLAESDEIAIDLYEANLAQEAINAEQDEAIIEI